MSDCRCCIVLICQRLVHDAIQAPSVALGGHSFDSGRCRYLSYIHRSDICMLILQTSCDDPCMFACVIALCFNNLQSSGELDLHAATNWDKFYQQNKTNFFKDRHYLDREFPELSAENQTILEVCYRWISQVCCACCFRSCSTVHPPAFIRAK